MAERFGNPSPASGSANPTDAATAPNLIHDLSWLPKTDRPLRILVAEDTRAFQEIVKAILGQRGHRIEMVGNGREAVDRLQQADFDIVLLDVQMPLMGGIEAALAIRQDADALRAAVPIVGMTAHGVQCNRESCLAAGMDDYLQKPFYAVELVRVVEWHGVRRNAARTPGDDGTHR